MVDANRFPRQAACSMVGVKPAIAQLVEHLTVELAEIRLSPGSILGGWICLTPYLGQKLADVLQCDQH